MPFLIGTKFDLFDELEDHHKQDITKQARKFARKMRAPLIYCSSAQSINVKKIFKVIIAKVFDLKPKIKEAHDATKEALIEFEANGDDVKCLYLVLCDIASCEYADIYFDRIRLYLYCCMYITMYV